MEVQHGCGGHCSDMRLFVAGRLDQEEGVSTETQSSISAHPQQSSPSQRRKPRRLQAAADDKARLSCPHRHARKATPHMWTGATLSGRGAGAYPGRPVCRRCADQQQINAGCSLQPVWVNGHTSAGPGGGGPVAGGQQ